MTIGELSRRQKVLIMNFSILRVIKKEAAIGSVDFGRGKAPFTKTVLLGVKVVVENHVSRKCHRWNISIDVYNANYKPTIGHILIIVDKFWLRDGKFSMKRAKCSRFLHT